MVAVNRQDYEMLLDLKKLLAELNLKSVDELKHEMYRLKPASTANKKPYVIDKMSNRAWHETFLFLDRFTLDRVELVSRQLGGLILERQQDLAVRAFDSAELNRLNTVRIDGKRRPKRRSNYRAQVVPFSANDVTERIWHAGRSSTAAHCLFGVLDGCVVVNELTFRNIPVDDAFVRMASNYKLTIGFLRLVDWPTKASFEVLTRLLYNGSFRTSAIAIDKHDPRAMIICLEYAAMTYKPDSIPLIALLEYCFRELDWWHPIRRLSAGSVFDDGTLMDQLIEHHRASPPEIIIEVSIKQVEPKLWVSPTAEAYRADDEYVVEGPSGSMMRIQIVAEGFKLTRKPLQRNDF
ncbi:hypothetical protein AAVH_14313 [Aphelenchoides avenae]|nr:hypothetical protein AAVH_14313 [Aphelenchus avenae]